MYDEKILKRLGYYLLMEESQKQKFKEMLYQMIKEENIEKVVEKKEKSIKMKQEKSYRLIEIIIKEQIKELQKTEQIQK